MLNLLPEPYKRELRNEEYFRLTLILGSLVILFLVSFFLLLLAIRIYGGGLIEAQRIIVEAQIKRTEEGNPVSNIRALNKIVIDTSSFYENQSVFSGLLSRVTSDLPNGIYVTSLHYTPSAGTSADGREIIGAFALSGVTHTVDDLLLLKENLEKDPVFSSPEIPPGAWKDPFASDVEFSINFNVYQTEE